MFHVFLEFLPPCSEFTFEMDQTRNLKFVVAIATTVDAYGLLDQDCTRGPGEMTICEGFGKAFRATRIQRDPPMKSQPSGSWSGTGAAIRNR